MEKPEQAPTLRDFKEETEEDEVLRPSTISVQRKQDQKLILFIAVPALIIITIVAIKLSKEEQALVVEENRTELSKELTVTELFRAFIKFSFGKLDPERLNSMKISGKIEKEGNTQEFALYKKHPNMALLVLTFENQGTTTYGMEGETVWQKVEFGRGGSQIRRVDDESAEDMKHLGVFFHPFIHYILEYNGLDPLFEINDRRSEENLIEVHFTGPSDGKPCMVILNGESLLIEEMHSIDDNGEPTKIVYRNYESIDEFMIPFIIENFTADRLTQRIYLDGASINIGLLSDFFRIPPEL
ncbi:MAG: hypothetical protein ACPGSB_03310 [Opitutales bacterium]